MIDAISLKTTLRVVLLVAATMLLSGLSMRVDAATTSYKYDSLNRLTQVTYSDGSVIKYTYDAAGNRVAQTITAPTPTETISTPSTPTGPVSGTPGTCYAYSTGGAVSNLGHTVQYLFDWGDGTKSGWLAVGTTSASKSWSANGTHTVTAQARCATDTAAVSALSNGLAVNIGTYTITVSASPTAGGTASPSTAKYASGATATVTATANTGYFFTDWTEGGLSVYPTSPYSFTVTQSRTLVANFSTSSSSLPNLTPYTP